MLDASPVQRVSDRARIGEACQWVSKLPEQSRGENTGDRPGRLSAHTVFVLGVDGRPLTPTTPAKARKLLASGVAVKVWSKFGIFGVRLLGETRTEVPLGVLGVDHGTKYEGYSVVVGSENPLNVKWDLPDKGVLRKKMEDRKAARKTRRKRKCWRRRSRSQNCAPSFIAPSQKMLVDSRLKAFREFLRIYPIRVVGLEDVRFHHAIRRWGANFSAMETGKNTIRAFFASLGISQVEYRGYETPDLRAKFGYLKTTDKSADVFTAHCTDSLALACAAGLGQCVPLGPFRVVDDTYRPVRRRLHVSQPAKGGIRKAYSKGTVRGYRKGLLVGTKRGWGRLCGETSGKFRYFDPSGERQSSRNLKWVSSRFFVKDPHWVPVDGRSLKYEDF